MGRGQPVGPLAASSDGGDIAADPPAARPVRRPVGAASFLSCRCPPASEPVACTPMARIADRLPYWRAGYVPAVADGGTCIDRCATPDRYARRQSLVANATRSADDGLLGTSPLERIKFGRQSRGGHAVTRDWP